MCVVVVGGGGGQCSGEGSTGAKMKEHNVQVCIKRGGREETENKYDG